MRCVEPCNPYFIKDNRIKKNMIRQDMRERIPLGNNPMVGATVAVAVGIEEAAKAGKF